MKDSTNCGDALACYWDHYDGACYTRDADDESNGGGKSSGSGKGSGKDKGSGGKGSGKGKDKGSGGKGSGNGKGDDKREDPCEKVIKRKCTGKCEFVDKRCRSKEEEKDNGDDNGDEKEVCQETKKKKCLAEKGCLWKKNTCSAEVTYDCGLIGSAKGDKVKKGKKKVNDDCECMEFCQKFDDATIYSFKLPKDGKPGACLCYQNMTKFKCSSKLISGLVKGEKDSGKAFLKKDGVKKCKQK